MARKRFSQEMKQEHISRPQFAELISKLGWLITGIDPDLGEDLFVRIFRNGVPLQEFHSKFKLKVLLILKNID